MFVMMVKVPDTDVAKIEAVLEKDSKRRSLKRLLRGITYQSNLTMVK